MRTTDKYVFFCKGVLGNWARTPMEYDGKKFFSSEQLFMYLKAKLFGDEEIADKISHAKTSKETKDLGRLVKGFKQDVWDKEKFSIMYKACQVKAKYTKEFRDTLYQYKDHTFVECNPYDHIWAIGLSEDDDRVLDEKNWDGENLLGQVLTKLAGYMIPDLNDMSPEDKERWEWERYCSACDFYKSDECPHKDKRGEKVLWRYEDGGLGCEKFWD